MGTILTFRLQVVDFDGDERAVPARFFVVLVFSILEHLALNAGLELLAPARASLQNEIFG